MRTWIVTLALLTIGCPKRVQAVDVPRTPEGLECLRSCDDSYTRCLSNYPGPSWMERKLRGECPDRQSECLLRCPGAVLTAEPAALPCCSSIESSCGDPRCVCDVTRCP